MRPITRGEIFRIATLTVAFFWVFQFLLTAHFAGGQDARWYGYTVIDALTQTRSGHWPVFVGQGELQWNGAVHPYLTAPYFLNLAILVDTLTVRCLSPLAVEHLVISLTLLQAVFLTYFLLTRLQPHARWLAWAAALFWVLAPLPLGYVVKMEMYMTVMTFGWLPLVFYGNVRLFRRDDWAGWACLASGLALTWMSHAAVAAWVTVITAIIQALRLLLRDFTWLAWRRALSGAVLFGILGAYYFSSVAVLGSSKAGTSLQTQVGLLGLSLAIASAFRLLVGGTRHWRWLMLGALGALWFTNGLYFNWAAGLLVWSEFARAWERYRGGGAISRRRPEIAMLGMAVAAVLAVHLPFHVPPASLGIGQAAVSSLKLLYPALLLPISPTAIVLSDLQLGYMLWAVGIAGFFFAIWRGSFEARIFALAMAGMVPFLVPVPGLTDSLMWSVPDWLYGITSVSIWLRLYPAFAALIIFTGFLALANDRWRLRRGWLGAVGFVVVVTAGLTWDSYELGGLQDLADNSVADDEKTAVIYRTDSAPLYYGYDDLPRPAYILNGVMDYHLESRLLSADGLRLLPEPLLAAPHGEEITLSAVPLPVAPNLLQLAPKIRLAPGEREIWKFEFFHKTYDGWFIGQGPGGYSRYYSLPDGGGDEKSFGVEAGRPKTLAFWNSLPEPQEINLTFLMDAAKPDFGDRFAKVKVQHYRPEDLQIQTLGLMPYRARVNVAVPSFLETPRVYIPGYQAKVDGRRVRVDVSPDHLAMIRVEPGVREVELSYHPTAEMKLAGLLSAGGWLGVIGCGIRRGFR
jgi:hypothetical protein